MKRLITASMMFASIVLCSQAFALDFIPLGNGQIQGGAWAEAYQVVLDPGELPLYHWHPGALTIIVNSGEITHVIGCGISHTYHAGEAFIIPAGQIHQELNNGSTPDNVTVIGVVASCAGGYNDATFVDPPACHHSHGAAFVPPANFCQ